MTTPSDDDRRRRMAEAQRRYRERHADEVRERRAARYAVHREREIARNREYRANRTPEQKEADRIRARAYFKNWAARNPDYNSRYTEQRRKWRANQRVNNPEKWRRQAMAIRLKSKYGVPLDRYEAMRDAQGGVCAVCRRPETLILGHGVVAMLSVDHDHTCCPGKKSCGRCVRGLLCSRCNSVMGRCGDDPALLRQLADYIDTRRAI